MNKRTEKLSDLWKETKTFVEEQEKKIVEKYISFLREDRVFAVGKDG